MLAALIRGSVACRALPIPAEYAQRAAGSRRRRCASCCAASLQARGPTSASGAGAALLALPARGIDAHWVRWRARASYCAASLPPAPRVPPTAGTEWCERRLLARIHRYTIKSLRAEIEPVASADFMRFLLDWQGVTVQPRPRGRRTAWRASSSSWRAFEIAAIAWESDVLPARLQDYEGGWLDSLCLSGRAFWARLVPPRQRNGGAGARDADGVAYPRNRALWQQLSAARRHRRRLSASAAAMAEFLQRHGASFFDEIAHGRGAAAGAGGSRAGRTRRRGRCQRRQFRRPARAAAADAAQAPGARATRGAVRPGRSRALESGAPGTAPGAEAAAGLRSVAAVQSPATHASLARRWPWLLLRRYGVVFRRLLAREAAWLPPWHQLLRAYRRLEAQGHDPRRSLCRRRQRRAVRAARGGGRAARGAHARVRGAWVTLERRRSAEPCGYRYAWGARGGARRQSPAAAGWGDGGHL